ncbi:MAG: TetR/AcrR family transcriptional regulator [Pseudomonadota bacterium]
MPRTPEFDRQTVILEAQQVFWSRGYGQTSVSDLVAATGLKPGSLYAAFGSKRGVFLEVLDAYNHAFVGRLRALAKQESGALEGLVGILDEIVDDAATGRDRRGCLAVNALLEMSQHDEEIESRLRQHNERVRRAFAEVVKAAQAQGDVDAQRDPADIAAFLVNSIWGLRVMCKSESDRRTLNAIAAGILAGIGNRQRKIRLRVSPAN